MTARRAIVVDGAVQGVGFRPFVYGLASRFGLSGFVRNRTGSVLIEIEGRPDLLDAFVVELTASPPPLARIDAMRAASLAARGDVGFSIEPSEAGARGAPRFPPEVATCADCLADLRDPNARRYRHPFVNCTNCGPRFTIVTRAPYDRARTSMAAFAMCPACAREYEDPHDRRFHAQPIACPACGPRLHALDAGRPAGDDDAALAHAVTALRGGRLVAVKGLGGYHLACDATNEAAVRELRRRKGREAKPFAVMVAGDDAAERLALVTPDERALLRAPARPIVLLRRRADADVADAVAPGSGLLGVMLPYTPLHHLLLSDAGGRPLVMTSGNRSDEPIVVDDDAARRELGLIADVILTHDRPIHARADDSVVRWVAGAAMPVRRSRGVVPEPLGLPHPLATPTLAVGGHLKSTFALGDGATAVLSQHLGDLDGYAASRAFAATVIHFERLFGVRPRRVVHDLHPDYASTRYALERAAAGAATLAVQHHHAHLAACLADNGIDEPVIGVCFDGAGLGTDGAIWGGEFLVGDAGRVVRAAHLRYVGLPGGERAIRQPWRMAAAHLVHAGVDPGSTPMAGRISASDLRIVERMLVRGVNAPPTSSVGRLFDAVAALVGLATHARFEGEAAMALEALAAEADDDGEAYPVAVDSSGSGAPLVIEPAPLVREVVRDVAAGVPARRIARRFHATLAEIVLAVCRRLRAEGAPGAVALSGGVFVNAILAGDVYGRLHAGGFSVYTHRRVPPNDGGLCLGQLAVVAARDAREAR